MKNIDIEPYKGDPCFKYIPRHTLDTFIDEVEMTQGQLLNYLPPTIFSINKNFQFTKKMISIGFWVLDVGFVTYCHKIKLLNRIFRNRWTMLAFKIACVVGPFFGYAWIEKNAMNEHLKRIYSYVQEDYRRYKNTGDILKFNPSIKVFDIEWPEPKYVQPNSQGKEQEELVNE